MKIIKPFQLCLMHRVFDKNNTNYFVTTIISLFSFDTELQIHSEIEFWKFIPEELGKDTNFDLAMPKPRGEVLLKATFFSRDGKPVQGGRVSFSLGDIQKSLNIFGDRFWYKKGDGKLVLSDPELITTLDISYENGFGGPEFVKNPLGKGYVLSLDDVDEKKHPFPNITDPDRPISTPIDTIDPAGFAPYELIWPQRFSKAGTYDQKWLDKRFPGFAEDLDPTFFNTAPLDQQRHGFFKGDEHFSCENLNPDRSTIHSRLPGIRPRCFINRHGNGNNSFQEMPMHLDTVWLFPHAEKGVLIYRGMTEVKDDEASDIQHMLLGYELMKKQPRELNHYKQALYKRVDKEKGHLYLLDEKDLLPDGEVSVIQKILEEGEKKGDESFLKQNMTNKANIEIQKARKIFDEMGLDPDEFLDKTPIAEPDIALTNLGELDVFTEKLVEEAQEKRKIMEKSFQKVAESMGVDYGQLMENAEKNSGGRPKFSAGKVILQLQEFGMSDPKMEEKLYKTEELLDAIYLQYGHYFPPALERDSETKDRMRSEIIDGYKKGKSFRQMDFTGVNLSGLNLQGIDLSEAFLEGADLSGSDFTDANLNHCMLARSNVSSAIFKKTQMTEVNLGHANLKNAGFCEAILHKAVLSHTQLQETRFIQTILTKADFSECKGSGVIIHDSDLTEAQFIECDFDKADFSGSNVSETLFLNTQASKINFSNAKLVGTTFVKFQGNNAVFINAEMTNFRAIEDISMRAADFSGTKLVEANLRGANLQDSNFEKADISKADLSEANLQNSRFYRSIANQTMFVKADLTNANMISINLFEGSLQKALLENTDLQGSNLFAADLLQADFSLARLEDANVQNTILSKEGAP